MGAELWYHEIPWRPDPSEALRAFQAHFFKSRYNFEQMFNRLADDARKSLRVERESGDRFGLVAIWENSLKVIEEISAKPMPTDATDQIALLRRVIATMSPEGFANVLDVTDVNDLGGTNISRRFTGDEVRAVTGTGRPALRQAEAAIYQIAQSLGRSESVCFELFAGTDEPSSWFFVGYTHD